MQLVPSLLAGPRPELKLSGPDRAWAVAGLTLAGKTAEDIASRIGVSLRLVRTIRSDPMTQVCMFYQRESETFASELRMVNEGYRAVVSQLTATEAELARAKDQFARLLGRTTFPKCGHPMDYGNTYRWTDKKTGREKTSCRKCHRNRMAARRSSEDCDNRS